MAEHIAFLGFETEITWGDMPDSPDRIITVFSTDSRISGSREGARLQIMTRSVLGNIRESYELNCRIMEELDEWEGFLHGDGPYAVCDVLTAGQGLGVDERGRHLYLGIVRIRICNG